MPKLYEYFGLILLFYSNEHEPVHVHGKYGEQECRAEFTIVEGRVTEIRYFDVIGRRPLSRRQIRDFKKVTEQFADEIVRKWIQYFVLHEQIKPEQINRRLP
ncbi:MAG TPA: DUF4160 domain-containing protein [Anaerolineae bacterium]|nr:DUF4160 domain-containing protein [Anaerolineae bacterium]